MNIHGVLIGFIKWYHKTKTVRSYQKSTKEKVSEQCFHRNWLSSFLMRLVNWISFGSIVTRLRCIQHKPASSRRVVRNLSAASWMASNAEPCQRLSTILKSCCYLSDEAAETSVDCRWAPRASGSTRFLSRLVCRVCICVSSPQAVRCFSS